MLKKYLLMVGIGKTRGGFSNLFCLLVQNEDLAEAVFG